MATEIEAAALLTYRAADMKDRGLNVTQESAMAKLYASEVCVRAANEGVQIFGGYGYTKDYPAEKLPTAKAATSPWSLPAPGR